MRVGSLKASTFLSEKLLVEVATNLALGADLVPETHFFQIETFIHCSNIEIPCCCTCNCKCRNIYSLLIPFFIVGEIKPSSLIST